VPNKLEPHKYEVKFKPLSLEPSQIWCFLAWYLENIQISIFYQKWLKKSEVVIYFKDNDILWKLNVK